MIVIKVVIQFYSDKYYEVVMDFIGLIRRWQIQPVHR